MDTDQNTEDRSSDGISPPFDRLRVNSGHEERQLNHRDTENTENGYGHGRRSVERKRQRFFTAFRMTNPAFWLLNSGFYLRPLAISH
jgi:hypothetical protein